MFVWTLFIIVMVMVLGLYYFMQHKRNTYATRDENAQKPYE
jgi:ABC-type cobalt transport system substrate-binding protein